MSGRRVFLSNLRGLLYHCRKQPCSGYLYHVVRHMIERARWSQQPGCISGMSNFPPSWRPYLPSGTLNCKKKERKIMDAKMFVFERDNLISRENDEFG